MTNIRLVIVLVSFFLVSVVQSRSVVELVGINFELALTSYKYAAILFYDTSPTGQKLKKEWINAAELIDPTNDIHEEAEVAMVWVCIAFLFTFAYR